MVQSNLPLRSLLALSNEADSSYQQNECKSRKCDREPHDVVRVLVGKRNDVRFGAAESLREVSTAGFIELRIRCAVQVDVVVLRRIDGMVALEDLLESIIDFLRLALNGSEAEWHLLVICCSTSSALLIRVESIELIVEKDQCILCSLVDFTSNVEALILCHIEGVPQVEDVASGHKLCKEEYQQDGQIHALAALLCGWCHGGLASKDREEHQGHRDDSNNC